MNNKQKFRHSLYTTTAGWCPVEEFLDAISSEKERAAILRTIDIIDELNINAGYPHSEYIEDGLYELKTFRHRVIYFLAPNRIFVYLHGLRKTQNKLSERAKKIAHKRRKDYLSR